jgi:hypothetical protein
MSRLALTKTVAAVLLACLCLLMLPVKADATPIAPIDVGSALAVKMWSAALEWLHRILPGTGSDPTVTPGPPKFGAGQSSDGRSKSGRWVAVQAQ